MTRSSNTTPSVVAESDPPRFEDARDYVPFPLFLVDDRGRVVNVNRAVIHQLGVPVQHSLVPCLGGATTQEVLARLDRLFREGTAPAWTSELRPAHQSNEPLLAHLSVGLLPTPCGERWHAQLSVALTPDQAVGNSARPITQELPRIDRRTTMRTLAAGVAHEIGNPLTYMFMCLDDLAREFKRRSESEHLIALLQKTRQGAQRVQEVVRGLSSFGRDYGRREPVDINRAVRSALQMARVELRRHIRVHTTLEAVCVVRANPSRLVQVLYNLIVNAADALAPELSDPALGVESWQEGPWVYINVWDTGLGIDQGIRDQIFEPFVSSKPAGRGVGLGLAVCHNYVAELGGEIDFDCEPGRGTRFTVRLPTEIIEFDIPPVVVAERPPNSTAHLLVVDDEPEIRHGLQAMLKRFGVVDVASCAAEARTLLSTDQSYDVVLCDLVMPGESGEELFRWIATEHPELAKRVAYVTGGGPHLRASLSEATAVDGPPCLLKPFRRKELYDFVRQVMARAALPPPTS